jgi:pimeloyl-ACP methyl ester carboxylesterase
MQQNYLCSGAPMFGAYLDVLVSVTRTGHAVRVATFVIVHGAWGGGWEWSSVAQLLRQRGHAVFTPTLTGMGDRSQMSRGDPIGLTTHIDDLVAVLEFEDLRGVVLCAASYGGMPVTGAADRAAERVKAVVYVDGLVPLDGQSAVDLLPEGFAALVHAGIEQHGDHWRVPMPPNLLDALLPVGSLPDDVRRAYVARVRDHPARTFTEPVRLTGAVEQLARAYVRCTAAAFGDDLGGDPIEACAARARAEGWVYRELAAPHDPQLFDPTGIADLLHDVAEAVMASPG